MLNISFYGTYFPEQHMPPTLLLHSHFSSPAVWTHWIEIEFADLNCSLTFQVLDPVALAAAQKPMIQKRESGPVRVKDPEENAGPTTTVFVGNISEKASDMLVRQLLAVSGPASTLGGSDPL